MRCLTQMLSRWVGLLTCLYPLLGVASTSPADSTPQLHQIVIEPRLSYEQYNMPDNIPALGVMGLHALVNINPLFYGGLGLYSAVKGDSGGYFALALEGGAQHQLWKQWWVDAGARVGGGGGRHTPVGGGLFIEPYAGLKYDFGLFRAGAYYSYMRFVDGKIASQQAGVEISMPVNFNYVTASDLAPSLHFPDLHFPHVRYLGSSQNYIAGLARSYFPNQNSITTSGLPMESHFEFLGIEVAHFISDYVFAFFNIAGAFHGHQNGYADELLGLGARLPLGNTPFSAIVKLGAGSGGGGGVDTGGGFIYEPMAGLEYRVNAQLALELNAGYVQAPQGHFEGAEVGLLLKYYLSDAILGHATNDVGDNIALARQSYFAPWRIRVLNQTYLKPYAESGVINPTMQLLGLDFDYFLTRNIYATGQTAFAYIGQQTGGYFSGMLGLGVQTPPIGNKHLRLFAEMLGGTAGGAGLDISQGALIEPVVGANYQMNDAWGLQASVGRLIALQGHFQSTTINGGISYRFWSIT